MATSKQTKTHSRDPQKTTGHFLPGSSPEDSSPHLRLPAKEHVEYQQWYENETEIKGFSFKKMYNDFLENPSSSILSVVVLVIVTIFAILAGVMAIRFLPAPKTTYTSNLFRWNAYRKIPMEQVGYEFENAILLPLKNPTCFTLDSDNRLYVAGDQKIILFTPSGDKLDTISLKADPTCLFIAGPGCLFENDLLVGYADSLEVYKRSSGNQMESNPYFQWNLPGKSPILRKFITDEDSIILADAGEKGVHFLDVEGNILRQLGFSQGETPEGFSGFNIPALPFLDVVQSPTEGFFFVTNPGKHRVEAFSKSGEWLPDRSWGVYSVYHEGFCGCCNPTGLSMFNDGRFLTTEKFIARVKVHNSTGEFQSVVVTPEELDKPPTVFLNVPDGTKLEYRPALDASQPVHATVTSDERIAVLDPRYCIVRYYREKDGGNREQNTAQ